MFETKKTLIVVYKDELLMNQLKKMVETHDDSENQIVGTRDDSINVVSWTEKVWLGNKKAGNIQGKILFLGEIKGTDKLIPVIDVQFDEYGARYGWAGNQAVVFADPKVVTARKDYDAFLEKLSVLPVPEFLKVPSETITSDETEDDADNNASGERDFENAPAQKDGDITNPEEEKRRKIDIFRPIRKAVSSGAEAIETMGSKIASKSEEMFRNKALVKRQLLFYGVVSLYNDGLERFMNN